MGGVASGFAYEPSDEEYASSRKTRVHRDFEQHRSMAMSMEAGTPVKSAEGDHIVTLQTSFNFDIKPSVEGGSRVTPDQCAPLLVQHMTAGTVHRMCSLAGEITHGAIFTGGAYFIVQDALGDVCKVGVYGLEHASARLAASMYPRGRRVIIVEPYMKLGVDGKSFVRVDNPCEIYNDNDDTPRWKELGTRFLQQAGMLEAAASCYGRGVASVAVPAAVLLTNRSNAHLHLEQFYCAARDAAVATLLDPRNAKALHHLAAALLRSSDPDLVAVGVRTCAGGAKTFPRVAAMFKALRGHLPRTTSTDRGSALWWETQRLVGSLDWKDTSMYQLSGSWEELKRVGNKDFNDGKFGDAVAKYTTTLRMYAQSTDLMALLLNHALAALDESPLCALKSASAALVIDHQRAKAWWRHAHALEKLGRIESAIRSAANGLRAAEAEGSRKDADIFRNLTARLGRVASARPADPSRATTKQLELERDKVHKAMTKEDVASPDEMGRLRNVFEAVLPQKMRKVLYGDDPMVPFHAEFAQHAVWPPGVSCAVGAAHLAKCYEMAAPLPFMMERAFAHLDHQKVFQGEDLLKRWLGTVVFDVGWLPARRERGDIFDIEKDCPASHPARFQRYNAHTVHFFSNQAHRKELFLSGTAHVAVGFVDFGLLLASDIEMSRPGPLRFIGIEKAAFSVAKFLVIWEVAKHGGDSHVAKALAILQMWYSAAWDAKTAALFAVGVRAASRLDVTPAVREYLLHWSGSAGVSARAARSGWAKLACDSNRCAVCYFSGRDDRIAAATYELTGDVGIGSYDGKEIVGSILMFDCPDGMPPFEQDASVFGVVPLSHVARVANHDGTTIFNAIEKILLQGTTKLVHWAMNSVVDVELIHGDVVERTTDIAARHPCSMSWSNLADYFGYREFHAMARACSSQGGTVHFGYSMNWPAKTFGASLLDYTDADARKLLMRQSHKLINFLNQKTGLSARMRTPTPTNPINTVSYCLSTVLGRKWVEHWVDAARESGPCHVGNLEPSMWNALTTRGSDSVVMTWTYDPEIQFQNLHG